MIEAVISDFGGVLTSPMLDGFLAFQEASGISPEQLGTAIGAIWGRNGANPLFELETGRLDEPAFLGALSDELTVQLGHAVELRDFGARYFEHLTPNDRLIDYMRELRGRGLKLAICTNNVREWEPLWRPMVPVDEVFDVVVDSAFVGMRKPEPEIYHLTLERLGVPADRALMIDDIELNCEAARELGIQAVWFQNTEQAIGDTERLLSHGSV